jgi:hypothetical protein
LRENLKEIRLSIDGILKKTPLLKFFEFGGNYEITPKTFKRKELCRSPANAKKSGMLER